MQESLLRDSNAILQVPDSLCSQIIQGDTEHGRLMMHILLERMFQDNEDYRKKKPGKFQKMFQRHCIIVTRRKCHG